MSDELERRVFASVRRHAVEGLLPTAAMTVGLELQEFEDLCASVKLTQVEGLHTTASPLSFELQAPLVALLWSHRVNEGPWARLMAGTIASACFGSRHLWEDLGAAGRPEVSTLMDRYFLPLAEKNVLNLKWKNHLFRCLGAEMGMPELRPPRCGGCAEQPLCFPQGPVTVTFRSMDDSATSKEAPAA